MRIAMIKAVVKDHVEIHLGAQPRHAPNIDIRHLPQAAVAESHSVKPFHGQNAARRELRIEPWDSHMRRSTEVARKLLQVPCFAREIELSAYDPAKLRHSSLRPIGLELGNALGQLR